MRSYVFTLGFHEDFVVRRLHGTHVSPEDHLLAITVRPVSKGTMKAFQALQAYCTKLSLREPELLELEGSNLFSFVEQILSKVRSLQEPLIVDISGGMRALGVSTLIAVLASGKDADIYVTLENEEGELYFSTREFRALASGVTKERYILLSEVSRNPGITVDELAQKLGKTKKTVLNYVTEMKGDGLLTQRGKSAGIFLTKLGEIVVKARDNK